MNTRTVATVMTHNVVTVAPDTAFKDLVEAMADERVSALPVVDDAGHVVGIVSEADLLYRLDVPHDNPVGRLLRRRRPAAPVDPEAGTAARLMSRPVVTVGPATTVAEAARLMERQAVKRLPVVDDDGRLVGVVSRRDLLATYLRPDDEIRAEVAADLAARVLVTDPADVTVEVDDGVVTLTGSVDRRSTADIAVRLVHRVPGVVDVVGRLTWSFDDDADLRRHYVFDARVGPVVRWPE